jgi:hypothetical protein
MSGGHCKYLAATIGPPGRLAATTVGNHRALEISNSHRKIQWPPLKKHIYIYIYINNKQPQDLRKKNEHVFQNI